MWDTGDELGGNIIMDYGQLTLVQDIVCKMV